MHEHMNATHAMMHKRNTRDYKRSVNANDEARARIKKGTYTTSINNKLNRARRGHCKEPKKIGVAAKAFSYN